MLSRRAFRGIAPLLLAVLAACGSGRSAPTPVVNGSAKAGSYQVRVTNFYVDITPQHRMVVTDADSVVASSDTVTIHYTYGGTQVLHGSSMTVRKVEGILTQYPRDVAASGGARSTRSCTATYSWYDQATNFQIVGQFFHPYTYQLFINPPSPTAGSETLNYYGENRNGSFNVTTGPTTALPPTEVDVAGGSDPFYVKSLTVQVQFIDAYGNPWSAEGVKSPPTQNCF